MLTFDAASHTYQWQGKRAPGVTEILQNVGIINYNHLPEDVREFALKRGSAVHATTHFDDEGDLDESTVDEVVAPYLAAWRKFRAETGFAPEPGLIEHRVYHKEYGFAGTLDRSGLITGTTVLADIKSNVAPMWTKFQLAAYASCFEHPRKYRRIAIELHKDGTYKMIEFPQRNYQADLNVFLGALSVYRAKEELGGGNRDRSSRTAA